ncbi:MAG: DNA methyltransferase [Acidobacteriota bacterium]
MPRPRPGDLAVDFHETWLGMVQPAEGLVVSVPILADSQCWRRLPLTARERLAELAYRVNEAEPVAGREPLAVSLTDLLFDDELLGFRPDDLAVDPSAADAWPEVDARLDEALGLWVPEGRQELRATLGVRSKTARPIPDDASDAERAGAGLQMLVQRLPDGLDLDAPEEKTGSWRYPPTQKFERLLRHVRVPAGLLTNGLSARLVYAPHGESSGWITFHVADMASVGGRELLDALVMLVGRRSFFTRAPEARLPALLAESRRRQADVTDDLAEQVFGALVVLLAGFETAAERDGTDVLRRAVDENEDHAYGGLLTVLLRLVFLLYAEDRGLLPTEHDLYAEHFSVLGLFEQLQRDAGEFPDAMDRRFGAWDRLIALFRAVWLGVEHEDFDMPSRRGDLFDPHRYPFLEGWAGGSAPVRDAEQRAATRVPSIDDATIYEVLRRLILFQGQRLSYKALDVEQIGSVYEALMGYHVVRLPSLAVCLKPSRVWVAAQDLLDLAPGRRAAWLQSEAGLARALTKKIEKALRSLPQHAEDRDAAFEALAPFAVRGVARAAAGRLVLQPGAERQRTSSHYTPRSLSGPIVARTLEPLLRAMGPQPSSEDLLELKICDPAMGSGAFLVEACRFLADQVVAAWTREDRLDLVASAHEDVVNHARRLVAQRCLYGVDKNRFAVDLAKLSLWLETLARDLPFTFLDHALRWGDSLVGLDFRQIRGFHWQPDAQDTITSEALDEALDEAISLRQQILDLAGEGSSAQAEKERLLRDADDALGHARLLGDLVVGAFFEHGKKKARGVELGERLQEVHAWLQDDGGRPPEDLLAMQTRLRERLPVFHWMLEFPEIFYADRPDPLDHGARNHVAFIDAFVGNPPFAGKNQITEAGGPGYLDWLKTVHPGSHGNADLSAHFFRLADRLLGAHGTIGLIATNTIGQGDTRSSGLQPLVRQGLSIYDAANSMPWPGGAAAVTVSIVHLAKGHPADDLDLRLDGAKAEAINSRLRGKPERPDPEKLLRNDGCAFVGTYVLGMGFVLTPEERVALIDRDPRNAERIFPYLGGAEVNSSPTQSHDRFVISFGQMSLEEAKKWPDLIEIVRENVKPERDRNKREVRRKYWWRFGEVAPALYESIARLERCLVTARHSKHLILSQVAVDQIFSDALFVFSLQTIDAWVSLQSRVHETWTRLLSSSMKTDLRYSASDCFETFPFPEPDPRTEIPELEAIGEQLYKARAAYLVDTDQGLTQCYNRLKDPHEEDPRALELRRLHEAMDRAVLDAYGWSDIEVPPYVEPTTDAERKACERFEDEVLDRLFLLNIERAEEEQRQGIAADRTKAKKTRSAKASQNKGHEGQENLFGNG